MQVQFELKQVDKIKRNDFALKTICIGNSSESTVA